MDFAYYPRSRRARVGVLYFVEQLVADLLPSRVTLIGTLSDTKCVYLWSLNVFIYFCDEMIS